MKIIEGKRDDKIRKSMESLDFDKNAPKKEKMAFIKKCKRVSTLLKKEGFKNSDIEKYFKDTILKQMLG